MTAALWTFAAVALVSALIVRVAQRRMVAVGPDLRIRAATTAAVVVVAVPGAAPAADGHLRCDRDPGR